MNKKIIFGLITVLMMLAIGRLVLNYDNLAIDIQESAAQEKLDAVFPVEGTRLTVNFLLTSPQVRFNEDNRVVINSNFELSTFGRKGYGSASISSQLRYVPSEGSFYLDNPEIETLEIEEWDLKPNDKKTVKSILGKFSKKLTGNESQLEISIQESLPDIKNSLTTSLETTLSKYPVYTIKPSNTKMVLAKMMLSGVSVKDQVMTVYLSVSQALGNIFLNVALVVVSMMLAIGVFFSFERY